MARSTPVHSGYTLLHGSGTGTNGSRIDVWAEYLIAAQDIAGNKSRLVVYAYAALHPGQNSTTKYANGLNSSITVDGAAGTGVHNGAYDFSDADNLHLLGTFDGWLAHGTDGRRTAALAVDFTTRSTYISGGSIRGSIPLPDIPRSGNFSCPGTVDFGETLMLDITPADPGFSHRVQLAFLTETAVQEAAAGERTVAISVPARWAEHLPMAVSGTAQVTLYTYHGGIQVGSVSGQVTLTVPDFVCPAAGQLHIAAAGDSVANQWPVYVCGKSRIALSLPDAAGAWGSSIARHTFTCGDATSTEDTAEFLLTKSGIVPLTGSVRDSRGRVGEAPGVTIEVLPYRAPALEGITLQRCREDGTADPNGSCMCVGYHAQYAPCGGYNGAEVHLSVSRTDGSVVIEEQLPAEENGAALIQGLDPTRSYHVRIGIEDAFDSGVYEYRLPSAERILHANASGHGLAVGKMSEADAFEVAWPAVFHNAVYVGGVPLLDYLYPVGSIYMTMADASPGLLFGGVWERLADTFLLGTSAEGQAGQTGGEAAHTLTAAEMPVHNHDTLYGGRFFATRGGAVSEVDGLTAGAAFSAPDPTFPGAGVRRDEMTASAGGGQPHNNMPPYTRVNMWRRTA